MCRSYLHRILSYLIRCLSAFSTYKFQKKQDPELIKEQKERCRRLIKDLSKLAEKPEDGESAADFFDGQIVKLIDETYVDLVVKFKKWTYEERERNVEREQEKQKWLEEERVRDQEAAEVRRARNREEAKREKENEAKMVEKAKQEEAFEAELRAQGESEESIKAILDAKAAEEKE